MQKKPVLGCIADDFTGATDLAALLARSGAKVSLHIGVPEDAANSPASSDIDIVALKCRTSPVESAINECLEALEWLKQRGCERFFWKYCSTFDSTDKGNIGPVAEALMQATGSKQTIYCPAFPENGRSIFMGNLFVGQQPLAESPMKDHPLTPMRDSNLLRLLQPQVKQAVGLIDRLTVAKGADAIRQALAALETDAIAHVVTDAVADSDLYAIAQACADFPLLTGGSAIAMPLPASYVEAGLLKIESTTPQMRVIDGASIVLSGSCSAMTNKQVNQFCQQQPHFRLDALQIDRNGLNEAKDWLSKQPATATPIIYATADADSVRDTQAAIGREKSGQLIEEALATLAVQARDAGRHKIVVAGGETSGAVTQALGVNRLDIGKEIAPGVPWTFAESAQTPIALALKSGNFGSESFFSEAFNML